MKNLPKNLRLDHGYLQARIMSKGQLICKNFGRDDSLAREMALEWLVERRREIRNDKFGLHKEIPSKPFSEAARLYLGLWIEERDPNGLPKHTPVAIKNQTWRVEKLVSYFGRMSYEALKPLDVQEWRDRRVQEVQGTTADKEMVALSSMYAHIENWIALERIKPFKQPEGNPCKGVKKSAINKRKRLVSTMELARLKAACLLLNDPDLWSIVGLALRSLLRTKDLIRLESGYIDTMQAKTGRPIHLPVHVDKALNFVNFRKRWEAARKSAQLQDVQFRDLRKTGANLLKMHNHSNKLISEFLGHSNTKTTELYMVETADHLKPLASELNRIVDSL